MEPLDLLLGPRVRIKHVDEKPGLEYLSPVAGQEATIVKIEPNAQQLLIQLNDGRHFVTTLDDLEPLG